MSDKRPQPHYVRPSSLNEVERKRNVDRLNFENQLMANRLKKVPPVISKDALEEDFERHLKAEANLRRRQMKPMGLPRDMNRVENSSSLFDSSTYAAQQSNYSLGQDMSSSSPIRSMTDFRKHVISTKKSGNRAQFHEDFQDAGRSQSSTKLNTMFELGHIPK